jgi:phosphoribosylglycinamide formyltransferase 1
MSSKLRLGVLASGGGSNLQAILDSCAAGTLAAEVAVVIVNVADAYARERARKAGIPAVCLAHRDFPSREAHDQAILDTLHQYQVELVVLAGYLRIFTSLIFQHYGGRIVNIHPALLPSFGGEGMHGLHVHQAVLDYGAKVSGLTVHFVEAGVDRGPIILQHCVPVLEGDTKESLQARILEFEHSKYPEALQLIAAGRTRIEGRKVRILDKSE